MVAWHHSPHWVTSDGQQMTASKTGRKWRRSEDAMIIGGGSEGSIQEDERIAGVLGRTASAVKSRRQKLKKAGLL